MRMHSSNLRRRRSGVAAVEFAMLLPLLMTLILGIWEIGRLIQISQLVSNAAREGGRQASSAKYTIDQVKQSTFEYLINSGVPMHDTLPKSSVTLSNTNAVITVVNQDGTETLDAGQFDRLKVTVSVPMKNFRWLASSTFTSTNATITTSVGFLGVKDLPIDVPTTIPQQPIP